MPPAPARRCHAVLDPLHSLIYFAPEAEQAFTEIGLRPGRMTYFASRAAPMGAVSAGVVTATFFNFNPDLVARHIPRAWTLADPKTIVATRFQLADKVLRRLLGDDIAESEEVAEAATLAKRAAQACSPQGRPLYAAHAELEYPTQPLPSLWHSITLLREYRGDGHLAALLDARLSGLDALISHQATGKGFTQEFAQASRGWSAELWAAGIAGLQERGLIDQTGGLTEAGQELRQGIEDRTDEMGREPYDSLGESDLARLTELGRGFTRRAQAAGAFPANTFAATTTAK
ncbi:MAG: SCO6745 family protein [Geodermatophilaceae bacterium]